LIGTVLQLLPDAEPELCEPAYATCAIEPSCGRSHSRHAGSIIDVKLKQFIPYRLTRISDAFSNATSPRYRHLGVSSPEWRVLAVLTEHGVASSRFLQEHTGLSRSRINRTLDGLVSKNWVKRDSERHDRRQNKICLTRQGRSIFSKVGKIAFDTQAEWLKDLTVAELSSLERLLDKLERNIPRG
jgi:DNA-binding MarR family transcriptional regulator